MFCCKAMKELASMHEPGFFIRIEPSDEECPEIYWLVFESAKEGERALCGKILSTYFRDHPEEVPANTRMILGTRIALRYCPWCGKQLMARK